MPVKCGKSHGYHESVADVRECYNGKEVPLVNVGRTPGGQDSATSKQAQYAADLLGTALSYQGTKIRTAKPLEAYGRREISELIAMLKVNRGGRISTSVMNTFGLVFAPAESDGTSLAPNRPANYTDPQAREGFVKIPGLDDVWVPQKRERFDSETLADGFYVLPDPDAKFGFAVYKVIVAVHGSGRKYARRLDANGNWVRTSGLSQLRPEDKMTLKEALSTAKRHGLNVQSKLYGHCFACGRTLTDDESIMNGIGPVCAGKFA